MRARTQVGLHMGGGIGGLLNLKQSGANYSYVYDGKGSVAAVLDNVQAAVAAYAYDDFGNPLSKLGTFEQPMRFSTEPYDETTGLVRYPYRFYAPSLGRWLSRDPIDVSGGLNLYAFVGNNPLNFVDPFGLDTFEVNRELGGSTVVFDPLLSHTLQYTTNPDGSLEHTYSWAPNGGAMAWDGVDGNWEIDNPRDKSAAQTAIDLGSGVYSRLISDDPNYDARLDAEIRRRRASGEDAHAWWLWNNCKTEINEVDKWLK